MRSNIARTWGSSRVPRVSAAGALMAELLGAGEVVDQLVELFRVLLLERRVGGHRRGGVDERARYGLARQSRANMGQIRARPRIAVLADLVAGLAARRPRREPPPLV